MRYIKNLILLLVSFSFFLSCSTKKGARYLRTPIASASSIAVIIDCPNNIKNVVMINFMKKGFKVKAVNASDLYSLSDMFDIEDYKYLAYENSEQSFWNDLFSSDVDLSSTQKSFSNLYKLHIYNYESHKAEMLTELKDKWNIRYLVILDLKDWQEVSWGRAIDLVSYDLIWVDNYPTKTLDTLDSVIKHFITSLTKR